MIGDHDIVFHDTSGTQVGYSALYGNEMGQVPANAAYGFVYIRNRVGGVSCLYDSCDRLAPPPVPAARPPGSVWVHADGLVDLSPVTAAVYGLVADACAAVPPEVCNANADEILQTVCSNAPPEVCGYDLAEMLCPDAPEVCAAAGL